MDHYILPAATYCPSAPNASRVSSPLDRRVTLNTIIEDSPQIPHYPQDYFVPQYAYQQPARNSMISPSYTSPAYSEDFPTPKASLYNPPKSAPQQKPSDWPLSPDSPGLTSEPRWRKAKDDPSFDELYDMTDEETEEVPLTASNSVYKKSNSADSSARSSRSRYPSLVIPSPSHWPTIDKLQKSAVSPAPRPLSALSPAQNVLSMLVARKLHNPANTSSEPSLDGSLSSEELEHLSCPSTPDKQAKEEREWAGTVQLHPEAMETLHHISGDRSPNAASAEQVLEVSDEEMSQVVGGDLVAAPVQRFYSNELTVTPSDQSDSDSFTNLTIPSPGGFFSSLKDSARHTWSLPPRQPEEHTPSTSVAENFYGVPWRERPENVVEHVIEVPAKFGAGSEMTPTPRDGFFSPVGEILEIRPAETKFEYNENYARELAQLGAKNLSRTSLWISNQENWLEGMLSTPTTPVGHERGQSLSDTIASPSKKSVRFVDLVAPPKTPPMKIDEVLSKDTTFFEALEFLREITGKFDAFIHRQTRAEAVHLQRRCAPKRHNNQLLGRYELRGHTRIPSSRPVSLFYTDDPNVHKEQIAKAQREQQALELIRPAFWALEASRLLHGGRLITSPAHKILAHTRDEGATRVLDLGGQPVCGWAWQVALDYPLTSVYTVSTKAEEPVRMDDDEEREIEGPPNHRHKVVPNYWTLPFPNGHFDVVSARSLHALLKTTRPVAPAGGAQPAAVAAAMDEYDLALRECMRILKPGGYLEFALLDADVMHCAPGSRAQAVSVEFAFNLRTRGYDPAPTKGFLPRLLRAGFTTTSASGKDSIRRAWTALPFPRPAAKWSERLDVGADPEAVARRHPGADVLSSPRASVHSPHAEKVIGPHGEVEPFVPIVAAPKGKKQHRRNDSLMDNNNSSGAAGSGSVGEVGAGVGKEKEVRGSTQDARDVAGLVGARAWEKWLVKLQAEMGKEEEGRLGEGVVHALEEGARDRCAWRCLEGWARKGF